MTGRVGGVLTTGLVAGVAMVLLGMEPRLVLVGLLVVATATTGFLLADLSELVAPVTWQDHRTRVETPAPGDHRVRLLRVRLRNPSTSARGSGSRDADEEDQPSDEIADSLVTIIDDHLRAEHGIDRSVDPGGAAAVLDQELARFVSDPDARRAMTRRRRLPGTVTLVEDLVGPDRSTTT